MRIPDDRRLHWRCPMTLSGNLRRSSLCPIRMSYSVDRRYNLLCLNMAQQFRQSCCQSSPLWGRRVCCNILTHRRTTCGLLTARSPFHTPHSRTVRHLISFQPDTGHMQQLTGRPVIVPIGQAVHAEPSPEATFPAGQDSHADWFALGLSTELHL